MKHDTAVFAKAYSRQNSNRDASLYPPCAHKDFVLIRMTGYAPDKALRATSASGIRSYIETNRMLGVSFDWAVTFLPVCIIACQVILEDLIVCATTEMSADMIQSDKLCIKVKCARIDILI
jgi:hypothetical protein